MNFWPNDTAGIIADVCSVLGLVVTAVLTVGAVQVRKQILIYPQHAAKLNEHCSKISAFLNNFAGTQNEIADEIGKTKGDLNSLRPYLNGMRRRSLDQVMFNLSEYEKNSTEKVLRLFLTSMYQLLTEMQNLTQGL
jgi:hypothetical protein